MKTPKQMAQEYADTIWDESDLAPEDRAVERHVEMGKHGTKIGFLAGYQAAINSSKNSESSDDSDAPDLQEQLEALQAYMTVAQRKIMALQANVEFLLYLNKSWMGERETMRRMQQTMQGFGRSDE